MAKKTKLRKALDDLRKTADKAREEGAEITLKFGDEEVKL